MRDFLRLDGDLFITEEVGLQAAGGLPAFLCPEEAAKGVLRIRNITCPMMTII